MLDIGEWCKNNYDSLLNTKIIIGPEERDAGIKPAASDSLLNTKNNKRLLSALSAVHNDCDSFVGETWLEYYYFNLKLK